MARRMLAYIWDLGGCIFTCTGRSNTATVDYYNQDMMKRESLPGGLDFHSFPSLELSWLITPIIFSQNSYLVYALQIPLLHSIIHQLYKLQPFAMKQQENIFVYIATMNDFIIIDLWSISIWNEIPRTSNLSHA